MQLFGLHYFGIVGQGDLQSYEDMLETCKSLDMNDFLHDQCPYVVPRPPIERRLPSTSQQPGPSGVRPPVRTFVEYDIFGDDVENAGLRGRPAGRPDPDWGTFRSAGPGFNEFGTNEGAAFMRVPRRYAAEPGSSSRGFQARAWTEQAHAGPEFGDGDDILRSPYISEEPMDDRNSNAFAEGAFEGERPAASPPAGRESGGTDDEEPRIDESPSHHVPAASGELDEQPALRASEQLMDKGKAKVDEGTSERGFIDGVEVIDLDKVEVKDHTFMADTSDSDDDAPPNPDGVEVRGGQGSGSEAMDSNVESASLLVAPVDGEQAEPPTMDSASIDDPLYNAAGKAPHPDAVVVKQEADWFQLRAEKRMRKTAEKLAAQAERERLAKDAEDAKNELARLQLLLKQQCGLDFRALLGKGIQVPGPLAHASTPAPTVPGVPSPSFVFPHGVCESQPPPVHPVDEVCGESTPGMLDYPRVEDNAETSSVKSLSPMQTDPPILPASPPPANPSPIVGRVLGFDSAAVAAPLQPCTHPRLEDTPSVDPRADSLDRLVVEPESEDLGLSQYPTGLEAPLRDSSLDPCKAAVLHRRASDDDDDDGAHGRRERRGTDDHAAASAVDSAGASGNAVPSSVEASGQGSCEPGAEMEGRMEVDLVDYELDPYETAMQNEAVAADSVFREQSQSEDRITPHDKVCFVRFPLYFVGHSSFLFRLFFLEARILVFVFKFP